jgi:hypothetical protein
MEEAKVASIKHQGEVDIAQAQTAVAQAKSTKAVADAAQLQAQLDASRAEAADLQARLSDDEKTIAKQRKT